MTVKMMLLVGLLAQALLVCNGQGQMTPGLHAGQEKSRGKILLYPYAPCYHSMVFHMERVAALLSESGYNVTMLVSSDFKPKVKHNVNYAVFDAPSRRVKTLCKDGPPITQRGGLSSIFELIDLIRTSSRTYCESLLSSPVAKTLEREEFDLAIVDNFDFCSTIVSGLTSAPFMTLTASSMTLAGDEFARYLHTPMPVSASDYPMGFGERTAAFLGHLIEFQMMRWVVLPDFQELKVRYGVHPELHVTSSAERSVLSLRFADERMEYPRPTYRHELEIAFMFSSLNIRKLDQAILDFIGEDEVLLISFGSTGATPPQHTVKLMMDGFKSLGIKVIWSLKMENLKDVPSNVLLLPWIPQTDLLASGKVRLFVTHGGIAGVSEGVYFGVPMIVCPMFGDQHATAFKVENFLKVGKTFDLRALAKKEDLVAVIGDLWDKKSDVRLKAEILGSQIRNDPDKPRDKFLYWVNEFVSRKGVDLELVKPKRPASMTVLQWLSIDIMLFLLAVFTLSSFIVIYVSLKIVGKLVSLFR